MPPAGNVTGIARGQLAFVSRNGHASKTASGPSWTSRSCSEAAEQKNVPPDLVLEVLDADAGWVSWRFESGQDVLAQTHYLARVLGYQCRVTVGPRVIEGDELLVWLVLAFE